MDKKVDLRIVKTYEKLRTALADMMREIPFDQITVYDLCTRAGIRRATFYKHFSDKYDFLSKIISVLQDEISKKLEGPGTFDTPADYYTNYVREIIRYLKGQSEIAALILKSEVFPNILSVITAGTFSTLIRDLSRDMDNGAVLPAMLEPTANFINGGLSSLIVDYLKNEPCSEDEFISEAGNLISKLLS